MTWQIKWYPDSVLFSVTALLVGEKLPPEAEIDVSDLFLNITVYGLTSMCVFKLAICWVFGH